MSHQAIQFVAYGAEANHLIHLTRIVATGVAAAIFVLATGEAAGRLPRALAGRWQFWTAMLLIAQDMLGHARNFFNPNDMFITPFFETMAGYNLFFAAYWILVLALLFWAHRAAAAGRRSA